MAACKSTLARAGTMELTADEGISYLKSARKNTLLIAQGLMSEEKPATPRNNSMVSTAKEAELILGWEKMDVDSHTRSQRKRIAADSESSPAKKVKLTKLNTMAVTARESKTLLGGKKLGTTRRETVRKNKMKRSSNGSRKTNAMAKTLEEALFVNGNVPDLNEGLQTRPSPRTTTSTPRRSLKRQSSMQKTAQEGMLFINDRSWLVKGFNKFLDNLSY